MKRLIFFIAIVIISIRLNAQDITISFQPKETGVQIDSVWVTNLKTNQKVKIMTGESLVLTKETGLELFHNNTNDAYLYPNPCLGEASLSFSTLLNQEVELRLYNMSGQLLSVKRQNLVPGQHRFKVGFPAVGLYTISVLSNNNSSSLKAICSGGITKGSSIDYEGSEPAIPLKNAVVEKTLGYTEGDVMHFSVFSGKKNTIITDSPTITKLYAVEFFECIDPDKQSYPIVKIGDQWWMAENLAWLPSVSPPSAESNTSPYYYVYGYSGTDVATAKAQPNYTTYGVQYNWPAALTACPAGWHLPSDAEWSTLVSYLSANGYSYDETTSWKIAKSLATATGWKSNSETGTVGNTDYPAYRNKSGFSGLPSGCYFGGGNFVNLGYAGFWWSSTEFSTTAWEWGLYNSHTFLKRDDDSKKMGFSVRCLRDI